MDQEESEETEDTDEFDAIDGLETPDAAELVEPVGAVEMGDDPADEPAEEDVDMADLLTVVELDKPVLVVDLRPRYHLESCEHLRLREPIALPVSQAREDGFTPCALCRPDAALAASTRRLRSANT